ncbi:MAG: histidine kinase [Burkholderiales bacterium]|nr:histidine kinase [Burkholderiales bacterium]
MNYSELIKFIRRKKLFLKFATVITLISLFAAFFVFYFFLLSEQSTGKGSAINVSGSLRMQTYATALTVAQSVNLPFNERKDKISAEVAEFQRRLLSPGLTGGLPTNPDEPLRQSYMKIHSEFTNRILPLAQAAISNPENANAFLNYVPSFVDDIDHFVYDLERELETRMLWIRTGLIVTMVVALLIGTLILWYFQRVFFGPLAQLAYAAACVRRGDFTARSPYKKKDEIGNLSDSFNYMVEDLARMYASLEEQVREKTIDLDKRNKTLNLLFGLRSLFSQTLEISQKDLNKAVDMVREYLMAPSAFLVLKTQGEGGGYAAATAGWKGAKESPGKKVAQLTEILSGIEPEQTRPSLQVSDGDTFISIPIANSSKSLGNLVVAAPDPTIIETDSELLRNIGEIFATALENASKKDEGYRLAIFEERSTIARELHDSIAQSLAYSRIQLTRLTYAIDRKSSDSEVKEIIGDLKNGVATAYRQLREVLTTFRIKPTSTSLREALRNTLETFHERSGIEYSYENWLFGLEINTNKQVHLLQILSEALSNIEKHAHASFVKVSITQGEGGMITLTVTDNGVGFEDGVKGKAGHFGMSIMEERARALGGEVAISEVSPHGVQVSLKFKSDQ